MHLLLINVVILTLGQYGHWTYLLQRRLVDCGFNFGFDFNLFRLVHFGGDIKGS